MSHALPVEWPQANQRYLMACVADIRARIQQRLAADAAVAEPAEAQPRASSPIEWALDVPPAIDALCASFSLTLFEREMVLLSAGVELDASFAALCARAHAAGAQAPVTFGFALAALAEPHWSALAPLAPLRRWRLIEVATREGLTQAAVRIDERVLHYLAGIGTLDERLQSALEPLLAPLNLQPSQAEATTLISEQLLRAMRAGEGNALQLCSPDPIVAAQVAAAACARVSVLPLRLHVQDLPQSAAERAAFARLCERELRLTRAAIVLDAFDCRGGSGDERAACAFVDQLAARVIVVGATPLGGLRRPALRVDLPRSTGRERRAIWSETLGPGAAQLNGSVERLAQHFELDGDSIRQIVDSVPADVSGMALEASLWQRCREQTRHRLDELAERITPAADWGDLVLPESQLAVLREVAMHVRRHLIVFEEWGFAAKSARGVGTCALFAGPSGTGKTMAAEVLASDLGLDLYRIDLSRVVSKYIGETEKNLARIFDAGERSGATLLFDEADALFGKRSEVRDSHDRYANIEVSYLLQRMEAYRGGLAILTTNMKGALDTAFWRRLRFVVQFPFPDIALRAQIWRRIFPAAAPTRALDVHKLARLSIAGGSIRNIALNAAFRAADEGTPIGMGHVLWAARSEYAKQDRQLADTEVRDWI